MMQSIKELYRTGMGPSSSHTMGPKKAAQVFREKYHGVNSFRVTLYGSLGATGRGHMTDKAIIDTLKPAHTEIIWKSDVTLPLHPNGMDFEALDGGGKTIDRWRVYSVGGGEIKDEDSFRKESPSVYPMKTMSDILGRIFSCGISLWEFVEQYESHNIWTFLEEVWLVMEDTIKKGLEEEGVLPGGLKLQRKALSYYIKTKNCSGYLKKVNMIFAYALATSEENAAGGRVVTAPTCGSCGVVPSVLYFLQSTDDIPRIRILRALATAGLIGNIVKTNASISGAEVGCQGEVGVACAMAAGACAQLLGASPYQIEYAAEMGLEHHLGLTCDPVAGLVQIPCIERNAMAATRAITCAAYALLSDGRHRISFDDVVKTMAETGRDMKSIYRETSRGGLARIVRRK